MTTVEGNNPTLSRIETGLFSLDNALSHRGQYGYPAKSVMEVYGAPHIGKSSLVYFLAGRRNPTGRILLCDIEGIDESYLPVATAQSKFDGVIEIISSLDDKGKMRTHESMMNELTDRTLKDEDVSASILDSVGAILPVFESESDIGEGFGAKRAVIVSQFARKATFAVNNKASMPNIFVVNHSHVIVSGGVGHQSAGGVALGYLASVRLFLRNSTADAIKSGEEVLAYVVSGTVEKLRYGGKGRKFQFVIVPGEGVRPRLSALIDCVDLGLATRGAVVKIGDTSHGYISKLVEDDLEGRDEKFEPFFELLRKERNK